MRRLFCLLLCLLYFRLQLCLLYFRLLLCPLYFCLQYRICIVLRLCTYATPGKRVQKRKGYGCHTHNQLYLFSQYKKPPVIKFS